MKVSDFLSSDSVIPELTGRTKAEVLRELSAALAKAVPSVSPDRIYEVLDKREREYSTGIGEGVAIPHGKLAGLPGLVAAFGISHAGLDFDAIDRKPTFLFFALVAPENSAGAHLKALARISRLFKQPSFRSSILEASGASEVHELMIREDARA